MKRSLAPNFNVSYQETHKELSAFLGCNVSLLDFSTCPTGTHKIIKAYQALMNDPWADVFRKRPFAAISSGNYAKALRYAADDLKKRGFLVISREREGLAEQLTGPYTQTIFIEDLLDIPVSGVPADRRLPKEIYNDLLGHGLEEAIYLVTGERVCNITNLTEIWALQGRGPNLEGEEYLVNQLESQLKRGFTERFNFVPCGSGELLCGLAIKGWGNFYGVTPQEHLLLTRKKFAMPDSFADKLVTPLAPMGELVGKIRVDLRNVVNLYIKSATEDELKEAFEISKDLGINSEPSGAAGLVVCGDSFRERHKIALERDDSVLIVNTGNGRME